ncbi:MAG TPA: sigma-54 dependent transcriptional regulator [Polyangiaceae bacterium]|nr:sigma-54 dependent transcriptional regulator [Polyangiaceae bacterium]
MRHLDWRGQAADTSCVKALERAGVALRSTPASDATLTVVSTSGKIPPAAPGAGRWLWLSRSAASDEGAASAVLSGAVDVLAADDPELATKLLARLDEASVTEPVLPETKGFVTHSATSRRVLRDLYHAAKTSMPVLLTGETGTGKELAARLVHDWSRRRTKKFVPIFCAAIPDELMEAELFGYVRGAFSGAVRDHDGQLMAAEGGSVFLDEIDDTPPTLQTKLLRVLEDRVVSRLGQNEGRRVDFRIIAATNRDLEALIARGEFWQDLYERLAILDIELPPLRERGEDLAALTAHFIERFYAEEPPAPEQTRVTRVCPRVLSAFAAYPWPGNVRELRNTVYESLVRKLSGDELLLSDLPRRILRRPHAASPEQPLVDEARLHARIEARQMNLRQELDRLERAALTFALRVSGGNAARAAKLLGEVGRGTSRDPAGTVRAMMRRLELSPEKLSPEKS